MSWEKRGAAPRDGPLFHLPYEVIRNPRVVSAQSQSECGTVTVATPVALLPETSVTVYVMV